MINVIVKLYLLFCLLLTLTTASHAEPLTAPSSATHIPRRSSLDTEPWLGDFDEMLERRYIRVLTPYSRTLYFLDKGHERGFNAELARNFERYINKKYAKQLHKRPVTVAIVPTTRDRLMSDLNKGLGDIVAGNLTATPERLDQADFVAPEDFTISELIVTGPRIAPVETLEALAGQTVHVRVSSSYYASLSALNQRLSNQGKKPVQIVPVPDAIEDEDLMEMVNAGLIDCIIVDDWKADIWSKVLPKLRLADVPLRSDGHAGWAFRKQSPQLQAALNDFYLNDVKKHHLIEQSIVAFNQGIKQIHNNTSDQDWQRFSEMLKLFEKYGDQYRFDPLMLAAQGYQESKLKQNTRGTSGAIGVMQVLPSTGQSLRVGDIRQLEPNIHAGTKYLDDLMDRYFNDTDFTEDDRALFAFASYNAGPGTINRLRREAEKRGLDANRWFNNLELVVADKVGWETTTYVRNIYKYYAAYKLELAAQEQQREARERFSP